MLWDNDYLYVAMEFEEPNVWGRWGLKDEELTAPVFKHLSVTNCLPHPEEGWNRMEAQIMYVDSFAKIFLDPDADDRNFVEFHVNALNNVMDNLADHGVENGRGRIDIGWTCPGFKSAVQVNGTLNNSNDVDRGWTMEAAIPWKALKEVTIGNCPPQGGDVWKAHLGRVDRTEFAGTRSYYTWPVLGIVNCYYPSRWGYVIFRKDQAEKLMTEKKPDAGNSLQMKMVWEFSAGGRSEAESVRAAKSLGFNAIQCRNKIMVEECHKQGIKAVGIAWFGSGAPLPCRQQVLPSEAGWLQARKTNECLIKLDQQGGESIVGGEIYDCDSLWCPDNPATLEAGRKKIDQALEMGVDMIALDGVGYINYYACFCPISKAQQDLFIKAHPKLPCPKALYDYSESSLVSFCSSLIQYAKTKKPEVKITVHIYPDFVSNPLYGNKIPFDYCGQTVAWFFQPHWGYDKIRLYANDVVKNGSAYWAASEGSPFIFFYATAPNEIHRKSPERIREEIRIAKQAGATSLHVAELGSILAVPDVAKVVAEELGGQWVAPK